MKNQETIDFFNGHQDGYCKHPEKKDASASYVKGYRNGKEHRERQENWMNIEC